MKSITPALLTYLNAFRPTLDTPLAKANLFTITLMNGAVWTFCDFELPFSWNSLTYSVTGLRVSGLKYKASIGLNVDKQDISVVAAPTDTYGGIPFLQALQQGVFDAAHIQRDLAFFTPAANGLYPPVITPIGTITMFKGRVADVKSIGRTTATIEVASDTVLLDIDMPRNLYKANCCNIFCDSGCGLNKASFQTAGNVGLNSTFSAIRWVGAAMAHQQGTIAFTSGANAGYEATIKSVAAGFELQLMYSLPNAPGVGDSFIVTKGCAHTKDACAAYGNLGNFRGFPYVPPPQIMTGPMATQFTTGGK